MEAAKPLPPAFDKLVKELPGLVNQELRLAEQSGATEPVTDVVVSEDTSIGEIEKLMEELRVARDYLRSEGERVRRINADYAHLTRTASASCKIIAESMSKWRTTEMKAATEVDPGVHRSPDKVARSGRAPLIARLAGPGAT
jgi:hypothetical protein